MADQNGEITLLKKTNISVHVDEALPDILVVTYEFGLKIFKGVLLDSTKRNLPCGIPNLNPAFNVPKNPDDDPLHAVNQRFAYLDPNSQKKKVQVPNKYKNNKMTVRLRPRQVLCSKCKGICNENSENVSRKRKSSETTSVPPPVGRRGSNAPVTRSVRNYLSAKRKLRGYSQEEPEDNSKKCSKKSEKSEEKSPVDNPNWVDPDTIPTTKKPLSNIENEPQEDPLFIKHSDEHSEELQTSTESVEQPVFQQPTQTQVLRAARRTRKKKSTSTTDDESTSSIPDHQPPANQSSSAGGNTTSNTRTIKISYGPQGEGTVLKIPAQIDNITDDDSEENINIPTQGVSVKLLNTKAARKAMKRAKKEARRKVLLGGSPLYLGGASPRYLQSPAASPRYTIGGSSPRYTVGAASPRQGLGNNSPRYMISPFEITVPRRRKHKMKHKKKHKEDKDRKHKESEVSSSTQDDTKEQCITQKLSINLKRLNNTYTSYPTLEDTTSSSDEHSELVPDFPPPNPPLMLRINAQTLSSALGADGIRLLVGDVVWGKIHGFPWWPGKILTITNCNSQGPQAHVAWYGSSTSSLMQCDQLSHYLDNFKVRYNKKKKGPYKEAIKQATAEARENAENRVRQPLGNSPSHNIIPQVVPPALASPREIDVVS